LYGSFPFFSVYLLCSPSRHAEKNPAADEQAEVSFPLSPVRPELSTLSFASQWSGISFRTGICFYLSVAVARRTAVGAMALSDVQLTLRKEAVRKAQGMITHPLC
jgi:hypothetical protein